MYTFVRFKVVLMMHLDFKYAPRPMFPISDDNPSSLTPVRIACCWGMRSTSSRETTMSSQWNYQIRIYLSDAFAEVARNHPDDPALKPLADILRKHHAAMKCQFDAFADYVVEAEKHGTADYPLYEWTKATIEDSAKKAKYLKSFTLYVDGKEVYPKSQADALESDLTPLVGGELVIRLTKHDTNPANNPQPPARYRK
jgi:hypothetical protein